MTGFPERSTEREAGSTDGVWTLALAPGVRPGGMVKIAIEQMSDGATEPEWHMAEQTLVFVYLDGRLQIWPWSSILGADYTPPKRATR